VELSEKRGGVLDGINFAMPITTANWQKRFIIFGRRGRGGDQNSLITAWKKRKRI